MSSQAAFAATLAEYVSTAGSGAVTAAGATVVMGLAYKAVRPLFKSAVNCHFCNSDTKVKYVDRNSWYCPYCGQYNGFTEDGDYNQTDHLVASSTPVTARACAQTEKPGRPRDNGLCQKCNLNQELKLNQLSCYNGIEAEFNDYQEHLERVYRLCAMCEEVVRTKLEEQNSILKPGLLEHRLETSRINSSQIFDSRVPRFSLMHELCYLEIVLSLMFMIFQLVPFYSDRLPFQVQPALVYMMHHQMMIKQTHIVVLALSGLLLVKHSPGHLVNVVPLLLHYLVIDRQLQAASACVLAVVNVFLLGWSSRKRNSRGWSAGGMARKVVDTLSAKMIALDNPEDLDETLTSKDSLASNNSDETKHSQKQSLTPQPTIGLFSKLNGFVNATSGIKDSQQRKRVNSPLIWSGDENTLNHEFVVETSRDCDLSTLTLGVDPRDGGRTTSPSPFSNRVYSPEPNPDGIRFTRMAILRPARLTSWVAGGYWSPPEGRVIGETLSRSSSQSSGFVSTGLISGAPSFENLSQFSNLPSNQNHASLPTSPRNSILGDCDRNSVLSAPAMKVSKDFSLGQSFVTQRRHTTEEQLSDTSLGGHTATHLDFTNIRPVAESSPQQNLAPTTATAAVVKSQSLNDKLSFTVTVTPLGFILAASLSVNFALMYYNMAASK